MLNELIWVCQFFSDTKLSRFKKNFKESKGENGVLNEKQSRFVFIQPLIFLNEITNGNGVKYISAEGGNVTEFVKKNHDQLKAQNEKAQKNISDKRDSALKSGMGIAASVTPESVSLKRAGQGYFVPVYEGDTTYYGGNQSWWSPNYPEKESRGCGPVAAANIAYYLATKSPTAYGNLYKYVSPWKNNFLTHMNEVYNVFAPAA